MRWTLVLLAGCGPMYANPSSQPPPTTTTTTTTTEMEPVAPPTPLPASKPVEAAPAPAKAAAKDEPKDPVAKAWLDAHNAARAKNCAPPLAWSPKLAKVAQSWANELQKKGCVFGHSGNQSYGENLAAGTIGALDEKGTVDYWYDEIKLYKFPDGGFSMQTGHFTQLVWTDTREVGCGHVQCKGNDIYVCNYDPPGNWEGEYKSHVLSPSCKKK